jgi:hypothetical protein
VLIVRYLDALAANGRAQKTVADIRSKAWREATHETRAACEEALASLNEHRQLTVRHGAEQDP